MSEMLPWKEYKGESAEQLVALSSTHRIDSLLAAFHSALLSRPVRGLTRAEFTLVAVETLQMEVNDGGYSQFFTNSQPEIVSLVVKALKEIDCLAMATITEKAIQTVRLPPHFKKDDLEREFTDEEDELLNELDNDFYQYPEPIDEKLFAYVVQNVASIRIP